MATDIAATVRRFVEDSFMFRSPGSDLLGADVSLLDSGVMDSTGVLELISFLESEFGMEIADEDIVPDNLDSIGAIIRFVLRKTANVATSDAAVA